MQELDYEEIFKSSFDTFKVFDKLTPIEAGRSIPSVPKTIWQILNHLIIWQGHQLSQLKKAEVKDELIELTTWIAEDECGSEVVFNDAVLIFENQICKIKDIVSKLSENGAFLQRNLKILQDLSIHLSFHLGEIILMRRMTGNYPLPHEMKDFLN
jgi:hypothetical protein